MVWVSFCRTLYVPGQGIKYISNADHNQDPKSRSRSLPAPFCLRVFAWTLFSRYALDRSYIINLLLPLWDRSSAYLIERTSNPPQFLLFHYYIFLIALLTLWNYLNNLFVKVFILCHSPLPPHRLTEKYESSSRFVANASIILKSLRWSVESVKTSIQNNIAGKNSVDFLAEVMWLPRGNYDKN